MNYTTLKEGESIVLAGCSVEVEKHDGAIAVITIADSEGRRLRVSSMYTLTVMVPEQPGRAQLSVAS